MSETIDDEWAKLLTPVISPPGDEALSAESSSICLLAYGSTRGGYGKLADLLLDIERLETTVLCVEETHTLIRPSLLFNTRC